MMPAIELYNSFGIGMESLSVFQDRRPRNIARHFIIKLPVAPYLGLFCAKLLDVFLNLPAEENFLDADKGPILEREFFIFEELIEVGT